MIPLILLWLPALLNPEPRMVYNPSASAPVGWYRVLPADTYRRGDLVLASLPEEIMRLADARGYLPHDVPVIKTIWAVAGDEYCVSDRIISFSEQPPLRALRADSAGRRMPLLERGCHAVGAGEVFLASVRTDASFDSRYFGPVSTSDVLGLAVHMGEYEDKDGQLSGWLGWARGQGADCKIKGSGPRPHLKPCLHITFYGPLRTGLGPLGDNSSLYSMGYIGPNASCFVWNAISHDQ